ncbi:YjjG family noncanonical pyrimidine nucleotidase [Vagococcus vulneris]|uniref:Noncanonical pyrimidine nucleotidase, YjjG family n=1 Tax=Vagococcus vulneris TaxID=1977869 RepID=A0A430A0L2_9ENTE|nr:YjjG family noncanonical pyrimidine nucleotidase [Vagococcus vulneris]RST99873.1 noncanonical pyrimidine nucleotidase, YjjG family [Vagococcus vulneris]
MNKYDYIIFDLDNTLLDFSLSEKYALNKLLTKYGVIPNEENVNVYKEINQKLWDQLEQGKIKKETLLENRFKLFFQSCGVVVDGTKADDEYRSFLEERTDTIEGAHEVLEYLKDKGYKLVVGTNGIGRTQRVRLKNNDMKKYFDAVFISEEIGFDKPDVRFFDHLLNSLNITETSQVLMVGDSLSSDILGAYRSGISSVWYNKKHDIKKEFVNYNYDEILILKDLLDKL